MNATAAQRIVFLDRATLAPQIRLRAPAFAHELLEHEDTAPEQVLPRLAGATPPGGRPTLRLADVVADAERAAIRSALAAADGKKILAAELLGISRATLYEKLSSLAPSGRGERRH